MRLRYCYFDIINQMKFKYFHLSFHNFIIKNLYFLIYILFYLFFLIFINF